MASSNNRPPGTPPTPAFAVRNDDNDNDDSGPLFQFTCDDYDGDRDRDRDRDRDENGRKEEQAADSPFASSPERKQLQPPQHQQNQPQQNLLSASPRSAPGAFLHPDHRPASLRPPSPELLFTMATDDGLANGGTGSNGPAPNNPFNFQTQFISTGPVKSNIGQRRGHRYKHSSISAQHQIFQEPPPRPPPVLPASLPIPTFKEAWASMQRDQRARLWWCCCHAAVAMYIFFSAEGSLAMTALSHLVFFDVGSAAVCVVVDVLGNFEVWRRSSIRHPFGLQRAEVLAGFAMSVFLVFGGFDLISHNLKHFLETVGSHTAHHPLVSTTDTAEAHVDGQHTHTHNHGDTHHSHHHAVRYITPGTVDLTSLAAIISTLVSAYGLRNHNRIRRVMRVPFPYLARLLPGAGLLANPFHFLTLCFSFLMLILPLLSVPHLVWLDRMMCAAIAASMFILGTRLAVAQGLMLLMSYNELPASSLSSSSPSSTPLTTAAPLSSSSSSSSHPSSTSTKHSLTTTTAEKSPLSSLSLPTTPPNTTVSSVLHEIESDPHIARVEEAQFWQVHYGLGMANLKVRLASPSSSSTSGTITSSGASSGGGIGMGTGMVSSSSGTTGSAADDTARSQVRARLARVVQNRLGEGYGRGGSLRWEVTVQMSCDG
ncbi:cation efflux family-domain-containing protein [Dichotomopilus funicola]|uniref:Zinc transporter n=1 Tax=Dichotomopilus funicola TaxID=1934379 RepID=A0AAN6V9W2_9PEZI|nr:cation efflux family-domain-containing protein [Dichotomopilus funicola]